MLTKRDPVKLSHVLNGESSATGVNVLQNAGVEYKLNFVPVLVEKLVLLPNALRMNNQFHRNATHIDAQNTKIGSMNHAVCHVVVECKKDQGSVKLSALLGLSVLVHQRQQEHAKHNNVLAGELTHHGHHVQSHVVVENKLVHETVCLVLLDRLVVILEGWKTPKIATLKTVLNGVNGSQTEGVAPLAATVYNPLPGSVSTEWSDREDVSDHQQHQNHATKAPAPIGVLGLHGKVAQ